MALNTFYPSGGTQLAAGGGWPLLSPKVIT
jgi:hypothetical protein